MSIKIISRGKGHSAVAAAAYRAGEKITNDYDGITHDYTHKGGIIHTEILRPDNAPPKYVNRATLWNAVEKAEGNKNAQLSREIELALPVELSSEQNLSLVRDYCQQHFVSAGMCADICVHDKNDGNPHAHVMLTMRPFAPDGSWAAKSKKEYILDDNGQRILLKSGAFKTRKIDITGWNDQGKAEEWRAGWAEAVNAALEQQGEAERIDHRSYERQGIEQIPTIHLGPEAFQMEKRGIRTERGDINRQIHLDNQMLRQLRARVHKLEMELVELSSAAASPSQPIPSVPLMEVLTGMLDHSHMKTQTRKVADLKTIAKAIAFIQKNDIIDLKSLQHKAVGMRGNLDELTGVLKKNERRRKTLAKHIQHAEIYQETLDIYHLYLEQKPKRRDNFYEQHRTDIIRHESAKQYLDKVLNGRTAIPIAKWRKESVALDNDHEAMHTEYIQLRGEVHSIESILRCVERVVREEERVQIGQEKSAVR